MLVNDDMNLLVEFVVMSCPSVPPRIITTQLYVQLVILLIVLYNDVILVWMSCYIYDSVMTNCDDVPVTTVCWMLQFIMYCPMGTK